MINLPSILTLYNQDSAINAVPKTFKTYYSEKEQLIHRGLSEKLRRIVARNSRVNYLIACLKHSNPKIRIIGATQLGELGRWAAPAVGDLIVSLRDSHPYVRMMSAISLGKIGSDAYKAIPALIINLKDSFENARFHAADALGNMGGAAVPALVVALNHENALVRKYAALSLMKIGSIASAAIPVLINRLSDSDPDVRSGSAAALGSIGNKAIRALPIMTKMLRSDPSFDVRKGVVMAVKEFGYQASLFAIPAIVKDMKSSDLRVRRNSTLILSKFGVWAFKVLPELHVMFRDRDPVVRRNAKKAFAEIKHKIIEMTSLLVIALKNKSRLDTQKEAAYAIFFMGPGAFGAVHALIETMESGDSDLRCRVAGALGAIGFRAYPAVPALIVGLRSSDVNFRRVSAVTLGKIGPIARRFGAIDALTRAQRDVDRDVRINAVGALKKVLGLARPD